MPTFSLRFSPLLIAFCLLPCLFAGRAGAQAVYIPTVSTQIISTSASGCVSDADLSIGSTVFGTDNAAKLQAILTKGASSPIEVVIDGKYSVGTTLLVYSNTRIHINPGCGLIARNGLNAPVLQNANLAWSIQTSNAAVPSAGLDHDIVIDGGGIINGNAAGQVKWLGWSNGTSTSTQTAWTTSTVNGKSVKVAAGGWTVALRFWGVNGLTLSGIKIYMPRTFAVHFADVYRVTVDNCAVDVGSSATYNYDGFHFNGPCRYISAKGLTVKTQDDGFALNADDGYLQPDGQTPSLSYSSTVTQGYGPITDVSLQGLTFADSALGIRVLSGASRVDRISLSDIKGRTTNQWLLMDNYAESPSMVLNNGSGNFGSISVDGADVAVINTAYKSCYIYLSAAISNLRIRNVNRTDFSQAIPTILVDSGASIGTLSVDGLTSTDDVGTATPLIDVKGSIKALSVRNVVQRVAAGSVSQPLIQTETGSSTGRILLDGIVADHTKTIVNYASGTLLAMQASNVGHTNTGAGNYSFLIGGTLPKLVVSNYDGPGAGLSGAGAVTAFSGDGISAIAPAVTALAKSTFVAVNGTRLASYTPDVGSAWAEINGAWTINSNSVGPTGSLTGNNWRANCLVAGGTRIVTTKWTPSASDPAAAAAQCWIFSSTDLASGIAMVMLSDHIDVYVLNGGGGTLAHTFSGLSITGGVQHTLVVSGTSSSVSLTLDNNFVGTQSLTGYTPGNYFGIGTSGTSTPGTTFQYFEVD